MSSTSSLIKSDFYRYSGVERMTLKSFIQCYFLESCFAFSCWWRLSKSNNRIISFIAKTQALRLKLKFNLHVSLGAEIGKGLYLGHGCNISIASTAIIGNNASIAHNVTIGSNQGKAATIGDYVHIAPNVCISNGVVIKDNVVLGAGSVVTKNLESNKVYAGVPVNEIRTLSDIYANNKNLLKP